MSDVAHLQFKELHAVPEAGLTTVLAAAKSSDAEVTLDLEMPGTASQSSNMAMSEDWYTALLLGEMIAPHCSKIAWEEIRDRGYLVRLRFRFQPVDVGRIAERLSWLAQGLHMLTEGEGDGWAPARDDIEEVEDFYQEWKHQLHEEVKVFDDLASNFVAELTVGLSEQYSDDELEELYVELRETYRRWWQPQLELHTDV